MEANGYADASECIACQMVYDPEDDEVNEYYAGPYCLEDGSKIKIGVFPDASCTDLVSEYNVDEFLLDSNGYPMKLA